MSGDGRTYRLRFDSAAVFIDFREWQDDSVVIIVHSPVLQDIDPASSPGAAHALNLLNDLNRSFFFVKFTFRDGVLIARYDLLGETLQAGELVNAIYEIAGAADRLDDELADSLGGKPFEVKLSESRRLSRAGRCAAGRYDARARSRCSVRTPVRLYTAESANTGVRIPHLGLFSVRPDP